MGLLQDKPSHILASVARFNVRRDSIQIQPTTHGRISMKQEAVVVSQFGTTASAYLTSAVHAQGADLAAVAGIARRLAETARPAVLDLGCGAGHVSFAVSPFASTVTAYDLSEQMLMVVGNAAKTKGLNNILLQQGKAESLPFADASFDLVTTRFSAHHWQDVPAALKECRRVLRKGGTAVFIDIVAPETPLHDTTLQAVELLRDASHVRDYRVSEWLAMLDSAGFSAEQESGWKLVMQFDDWVTRMRTPPARVTAIRSLFDTAPEETSAYFEVQPDYSFAIDGAMLVAHSR